MRSFTIKLPTYMAVCEMPETGERVRVYVRARGSEIARAYMRDSGYRVIETPELAPKIGRMSDAEKP